MILKSQQIRQIGMIISNGWINDEYGNEHHIPFKVLAEVTIEDYKKYCDNHDPTVEYGLIFPDDRFYLISID